MKKMILLLLLMLMTACIGNKLMTVSEKPYDEAALLEKNRSHEKTRMQYKLIQSKVLDKKKVQKTLLRQIKDFTEKDYINLRPYIYEKDIPSIQKSISSGAITYKRLVQWYLYRINKFEFDPRTSLHTIIAINPNAVKEAEEKDSKKGGKLHQIYGMPILLKDNIDAKGMPTSAGALALKDNMKEDAFIVEKMKSKGAIILGKVNLSEWAYFFCGGCPVGYSAIGGQTLNPYGRMIFETGGSSAGSGVAMAANYAVAAIGTETSGSILSPSSQNSVVGLKPTVGLLSRSGIVPISSTLDTPGPMTRTVSDNAILLSAIVGKDESDPHTAISVDHKDYFEQLTTQSLEGLRIGANKNYMEDNPIYAQIMVELQKAGAEVFGFEPKKVRLEGFASILNIDMKHDLPKYLSENLELKVQDVADVIAFNEVDMALRAPYGQERLEGILTDTTSAEQLKRIITKGREEARSFFDEPMEEYDLDVLTSINNYDAGRAALAHYPALTLPMGYKETGEPINLTLIGPRLSEEKLLKIAYAIERQTRKRRPPEMED